MDLSETRLVNRLSICASYTDLMDARASWLICRCLSPSTSWPPSCDVAATNCFKVCRPKVRGGLLMLEGNNYCIILYRIIIIATAMTETRSIEGNIICEGSVAGKPNRILPCT